MNSVTPPNSDEPVVDGETLTLYLTDAIDRALQAHLRAAPGTVRRTMSLGEALALFNLADQFGVMDAVRRALMLQTGRDAYLEFSSSMKDALLDRGLSPSAPRDSRPRGGSGAPRPERHRPPKHPRSGQ